MSSSHEIAPARIVGRAQAVVSAPSTADGAAMWRVAHDSGSLDLNSSYAYLLYARDFADTCRVATVDGSVVGFVLGHRLPADPACLFVWQIAVDASQRGRGLSSALLDDLVHALTGPGTLPPVTRVETTITDDNVASQRLFRSFAERWGADVTVAPRFEAAHFPDGHDAEPVYRIGPLTPAGF